MDVINITTARQNFYAVAEKAVADSTPIKITAKRGDVVLMAQADYDALMETVYLLSVPGLRDGILAARAERFEDGIALEDAAWLAE